MPLQEVKTSEFEAKVIQASSNNPVVVDFWAAWCGPCRMITPIIEDLDKEYDGKIAFYKLDTEESPEIASRYNVMSIPTLIMFKDGEVVDTIVGVLQKPVLKKKFDEHIAD